MSLVYDELIIATKREIAVCEDAIKNVRKTLAHMEGRYAMGTPAFIEKMKNSDMGGNADYELWYSSFLGLGRWEERLEGLREILRMHFGSMR
ncbi:MAG TPA: hypothetical protein VFG09_05870 [Thermodesulfovibrionales bacterium]|nr:hypothetical protein [Thermodesulfovibrionales bacterium]